MQFEIYRNGTASRITAASMSEAIKATTGGASVQFLNWPNGQGVTVRATIREGGYRTMEEYSIRKLEVWPKSYRQQTLNAWIN